jgi:hypothetical protein
LRTLPPVVPFTTPVPLDAVTCAIVAVTAPTSKTRSPVAPTIVVVRALAPRTVTELSTIRAPAAESW